jgi:hypothetical protein
MKVGDLVQLSAYAKKLKQFYIGRDNDLGLICSCHFFGVYSVRWISDGRKALHVDRKDLIYAKIKK